MKRKHDMDDEWLWDRIDEDLMAMADEREKLLMESEELQGIEMPSDMLDRIHREIAVRDGAVRKHRIRRRVIVAVAAAVVSCVGMGLIGYGSREYEPEIIEREVGNDTTTKVNNSDAVASEYDEEEVCQEIQKELGLIPVRLGYQPQGMHLVEYSIVKNTNEALVKYKVEGNTVHVYLSKDHSNTSINYETDGKKIDTLKVDSSGLEIEVFEYEDLQNQTYYISSFKYLNTFYSVHGMIDYDEFIKILENIIIENV